MSVALIIILILAGLALIVVEVVVLPGVTVAGIAGGVLAGCGVFFAYRLFGSTAGASTLTVTGILFIALLIYAVRAKTWDRLSLHSEIDGKVNVVDTQEIHLGDNGLTISRLAPVGKILIHDKIVEGKSEFGLIDENTEVHVVQVDESTIVVQKLNN
jgi:membrane-bound ClpP family serine protease